MKVLLTGARGQLGFELRRTLAPLGTVIACDRTELDLAGPASIRNAVRATAPTLIVNAGAYTAVDQAESEPELAMAINGVAPGILAEEAKRIGAAIVHYSTDYVFDGNKNGPYVEDDLPNPLSVYGRTKLAGEQAVAATGVPHLIFRTSWIYGMRGRNSCARSSGARGREFRGAFRPIPCELCRYDFVVRLRQGDPVRAGAAHGLIDLLDRAYRGRGLFGAGAAT